MYLLPEAGQQKLSYFYDLAIKVQGKRKSNIFSIGYSLKAGGKK